MKWRVLVKQTLLFCKKLNWGMLIVIYLEKYALFTLLSGFACLLQWDEGRVEIDAS